MRPTNVFLIMELSNSRDRPTFHKKVKKALAFQDLQCYTILSLTVDGRKKSLYPLYLLGCSDFCRCCGL